MVLYYFSNDQFLIYLIYIFLSPPSERKKEQCIFIKQKDKWQQYKKQQTYNIFSLTIQTLQNVEYTT